MLFSNKDNNFGREIFSPSEVTAKIQETFDETFGYIWVAAELSELTIAFSGHAYFTLKDRSARLKAVMWKGRRAYAAGALEEGLSVLARGQLSVYAPRGEYQLVVDYLEPQGEGALRLAFEKMKKRLEDEGVFEEQRKRPLPFWPRKVALISSAGGAASRDFIQTAKSLRPNAAISLYPVRVQGEGAAAEIVQALSDINVWGGFDLIVLTRGGGSLTDLWAFNEEAVVRAVAASRIPTLAAIGHSTDLSLTELAADAKAITPTAAAEYIYRDQEELLSFLSDVEARLSRAAITINNSLKERLALLTQRLGRGLGSLYGLRRLNLERLSMKLARFQLRLMETGQLIDHACAQLRAGIKGHLSRQRQLVDEQEKKLWFNSPRSILNSRRDCLGKLEGILNRAIERRLVAEERAVAIRTAKLEALSPMAVLKRGYALVTPMGSKNPLMRAADIKSGQSINVRLAHGALSAAVEDVHEEKE